MKIQETSLEHHIGLHSALLSKDGLNVFMCFICSKINVALHIYKRIKGSQN